MSFEAKLKRGLAALTTEQLRDTNIYAGKPHTHTHGCTCAGFHGYIREMVTFTQTSQVTHKKI